MGNFSMVDKLDDQSLTESTEAWRRDGEVGEERGTT